MDNAKLKTPASGSGSVQGKDPAVAQARRAAGIFPAKPAPDALVAPLGWAGILTFFVLTFPTVPLGIDIDSSWSAVLVYAHQHGLQFGKDIVFTYGPLGFLTVPYYAGQGVAVRMLVDFALCFGVTSGLCLLGWRMGAFWRAALFTVFIFLVSNTDPRTDVLVNHGLLCWGLLCLVENGRRLAWFAAALTALAAFVALTKITFLFAGMLGILAIGADLALRGRTKLAMAMAGGFFAGWLLGWLLAGQLLSNIPSFLVNALLISRDYDANMGQEASRILKDRGFWVAALIVLVTLARVARAHSDEPGKRLVRRALLMLWLSSFIFLAWKHGFVRADRIHIEVFLGFAPVFAIGLELLRIPERWLRWVVRAGTVACCYFCLTTLQWIFPGDAKYTTLHPLKLAVQNLNYVVRPGSYLTNMNEVLGLERSATQLPRLKEIIGTAPVDVFGFDQCYALFNGLNYRPRPIFQSYAAYNSRLATLNEQFYASTAAPEHILYKLLPIDRRFPALEDARLFRDLLVNYAPANVDGEFLLLKRSGNVRPSVRLLDERAARPGEYVDLARYGERDLWIELGLQPSRLGACGRFFTSHRRCSLRFGKILPDVPCDSALRRR
jgi:hypothetical protein